jgi:hypothetical protein
MGLTTRTYGEIEIQKEESRYTNQNPSSNQNIATLWYGNRRLIQSEPSSECSYDRS